MLINFENIQEVTIPNMNKGEGSVSAKMFMDNNGKIMMSRLPKGSSIGEHIQATSSEINYVLSGTGVHICNGVEEPLSVGICCYCPKGSSHSIVNTGTDDLVLFTVVSEQ